ncbi:hypothetical protein DQ04_03801010 [Trypanosoma grayi]|uniref:hypothetical protein n=1 Tax=Trypanosoma grayi TaxID=71804 RepID=UPI0004F48FF1|nr:hypothetical protein DQ04_03801010 [Trypanosoma grayi]KEG10374.1 hypothetical protein DQ04_03801010 [Trypanosoma grayi]
MGCQHEDSVAGRFEKVIALFLDGIPRPFVRVEPEVKYGVTFDFSLFGFSPDYTGQTETVLFPEFRESFLFDAVCLCQWHSPSPSARIGAHYSPYVGTFRLDWKGPPFRNVLSSSQRHAVRIPIETCEEMQIASSNLDRELRTSLLVDLYEKIAKEHLSCDRDSLRRIIVLATLGVPAEYRIIVERVVSEIKKVYMRACTHAIYQYMNQSSLFRQIVSPLCLDNAEDNQSTLFKQEIMSEEGRFEVSLLFNASASSLKASLPWGVRTHQFFMDLQNMWMNRFDRLVIFDTTTANWKTDAEGFLGQLECSMRAAFTKLRIEFYTQLEQILFGTIRESGRFMSLDSQTLKESELGRIFLAVRVFLVNHVRTLILDALKDLVFFFESAGDSIVPLSKARKRPLLEVSLTVGGCGLPRSSSFARLRFGIADLLDELLDSANSLPTPEVVIMRTLDFERRSLNSFDAAELSMKAVLVKCLDATGCVIEELTEKYSEFSNLPPLTGAYFTRVKSTTIQDQVCLLREGLEKIGKNSPDVVFCGCIAINCTEVKRYYSEQWLRYIENYLAAIQSDFLTYLIASVERCRCHSERLSKEPKSVEELEELCRVIKDTETLSKEVEMNDCKRVIEWFECLESLRIPVNVQLYAAAVELMRRPSELMKLAWEADEIRAKSRPFLIEKLGALRNNTRSQVTTIRDGVDELLSLFNLDVCDIAAQTCEELRVIVDQVLEAIDHISYCERSLEIEEVDSFEDFFPLLKSFEVLEQFWGAVFDSTVVKDYYKCSVNNLAAEKMIENVQQCRRLLHSSTRSLRAYPGLVRLGRQQEQVLTDFESLEGILICITTPGLRKSHWKEIARILGPELKGNKQIDSSVTLRTLLEAGIQDHLDELQRVVDPALVDFNTEAALERMKSEAKKTRFLFELVGGTKDAFAFSPACKESIRCQLESFLYDLRKLRLHDSLSHFVVNSISEWKAASEKMRGTLQSWEEVEQEWIEILHFGMTLDSMTDDEVPVPGSREWKFLHEKVSSINDIFRILSTTLQKPQYTLFTAMMQENIQEELTLACTILSDIKKVLTGLFDSKREAFPRFHFLSDAEMFSFLSVLNKTSLTRLLSKMYSRVFDVNVESNAVTAFITVDGATLRAEEPIALSPVPIERWMGIFDKNMRFSLLRELHNSVESHYHLDPLTWLRDSCVQVVDVALRVIHNRDLREALSIAGSAGITAYSKRLKDLTEEYIRLAGGGMDGMERRVFSSAITLLLHCGREVQMILKSGVQTTEDLDRTAMLQTVMDNDGIAVQMLGFRFKYGMEFLGNYTVPMLTPEFVEKALYSVFVSFSAPSFPILVGEPEEGSSLEYCAQYLGRFWYCIQCHPQLTLERIARGMRGALSVGAVLCLKDVDLLKMSLLRPITKLLQSVESACRTGKELHGGGLPEVYFEVDGDTMSVHRDPCFQVVLTAREYNAIPTSLGLAFRPIFLPPVDLSVLAQGTLQALGFSQCMAVGQRLAAMYAQFMEVSPSIFTLRSFLFFIRDAANNDSGTLAENLCTSFLYQFWQVVRTSELLGKLLEWNVVHTLGISQELWEDALTRVKAMSGFDGLLEQFTRFITFNTNVVLVGPVYSGKTRLWKRWVGNAHYAVFSFRLMSSAEVYGDARQPGLLSSLAKRWDPLVNHTIIIEGASLLRASIAFDAPTFQRIRPYSWAESVKSPLMRVIMVTSALDNANPRVMTDFAVFALSGPTSWKAYLKELLLSEPSYHAAVAFPVMASLIDGIMDTRLSLDQSDVPHENKFSVSQRCSHLYKRWFVYAQSRCTSREEWISESAFALQCAVFATCWSLGLRLREEERSVLSGALEKVQSKLNKVAKEIGFTDDVLPPLENDILFYIATPVGWKRLGKSAVEAGFTSVWAHGTAELDLQKRVWSHFFHFPSRETTLTALEHLICAGQPMILIGKGDQGKSTILRHMRKNEQWEHQMVYNNEGCKAVEVQEILLQSLSLRQSKLYGPSVGRRLVLCVDDVHLSGDKSSSQAMDLFSFINRFSAICPPSVGYIPITDVVCVGSSPPGSSYTAEVEGTMVRLWLPHLEESEVLNEVRNLLNAACATRRGLVLPREVCAFLASAQAAALHLMFHELVGKRRGTSAEADRLVNGEDDDAPNEYNPRRTFGSDFKGRVPLSYINLFMKISDRVLRFLSTQWEDRDAVINVFCTVYAFYTTMLHAPEQQQQLQILLKQSANATLNNCFGSDPVSFEQIRDEPVMEGYGDTELPPYTASSAQEWLRKYEAAVASNVIEEPLNTDNSTAVVFVPPPIQGRKSAAVLKKALAPRVSQVKYASRWITFLTATLHQCLRQEQTHVALIGPYDRGIRRAIRVWATAVHVHVAFLRDNYAGPTANEYFKKDLIDILQHTCRHDGRLVVFVPNSMLALGWPMGQLDAIVRGGNMSQLFTFDEQLFLLHGRRGIRRTSGRLTVSEHAELRRRVCRRLSLVVHFQSHEEVIRVGKTMPLISIMSPVPLRASEMLKELVDILLSTDEFDHQVALDTSLRVSNNNNDMSVSMMSDVTELAARPYAQLLCDIFDAMKLNINLQVEQLLEFVFQAQQLRWFLWKLRRHSAQSRHIAELPNAIIAKKEEYEASYNEAAQAKETAEQQMRVLLDYAGEEEQQAFIYENTANRHHQEATATELIIIQEEEAMQAKTGSIAAALTGASTRLSAMKSTQIKQFATLPPITKGAQLVKAVCKILGEEVPPGTSKELWEYGKSIMTAPKFASRLLAVLPSSLTHESFSQLHASLREARFGELSPFASAVAEYVVSLMEASHVGEEVREIYARLNEKRLMYSESRGKKSDAEKKADEASRKAGSAHAEARALEEKCKHFSSVMEDATKRQHALVLLTDIVDRFAPFHSPEEAAAREEMAEIGEGAVLMVAAYRAFFAALPATEQQLCFDQLELLLSSWDVAMPKNLQDPIVSLLFPTMTDITDSALVRTFSIHERLCVSALLQRTHLHWPCFGGVRPTFERVVNQCLKSMCGDCIVTSALDNNFSEGLLEAAKNGWGLLLCDVNQHFLLKRLRALLLLQPSLREARMRNDPLKCSLFGENVEINPSFFLVCVSSAVVQLDEAGHAASRLMTITNFHLTISANDRLNDALLLTPNANDGAEVNDLFGAPKDDKNVLAIFRDAIHEASSLLCENIEIITGNKDGVLDRLDKLVGDLNAYHVRVSRISLQQEFVQKRVTESWKYLKYSIYSVERALRVIETKILGRHWSSRKLEALITSVMELSRPYQRRISPNTFESIPEMHKEFYASTNFVERVVQVFACGWPCELRGLFAWYLLSAVINECGIILRLRGELYSSSTVLLNREQYKVLDRLLDRRIDAIDEEFVHSACAASSDALLNDLAFVASHSSISAVDNRLCGDEEQSGGGEGLVRSFFANWMKLNYVTCEWIASHLYDAFIFAVKEQNTDGEDEVAMLYEYIGQHPASVHSIEEWLRFSLSAGVPFSLRVPDLHQGVKRVEQRAKVANLSYHFHRISTPEEMEQLMDNVSEYFRTRPLNQGRGHCVLAMLVPPTDASNEIVFAEALSAQLSRFCQYGAWGQLRNGDTSRFPVLLCCAVRDLLRGKHGACAQMLENWCFAMTSAMSLSRFHLLNLLQEDSVFAPWKREGTTLLLEGSYTTERFQERQSGTARRHGIGTPQVPKIMNAIELHVGLISLQIIRHALWDDKGFGDVLFTINHGTVDTEDLSLILRLTAMWVRNNQSVRARTTSSKRRSVRLPSRLSHKVSVAEDENDGQRQYLERVKSVFNKIAYSIYAARVCGPHCSLAIGEILRQRMSTNESELTQFLSASVAIDETAKNGFSDSAFLNELQQSNDDFYGLCGDDTSAEAYRDLIDGYVRNLLYGSRIPPKLEVPADYAGAAQSTKSTPLTTPSASSSTGIALKSESPAMGDIIELMFLWEDGHGERLDVALKAAGNVEMAARVRAAVERLRCWMPGDTLAVWLPSLRHPRLLLHAFAAQAVSRKADELHRVGMVLVILRRYNLLHDDIVLTDAWPSSPLEQEVLLHTDWDVSCLSWKKSAGTEDTEEDVIIAARFQRVSDGDSAGRLNDVMWDVRPGEKLLEQVTTTQLNRPSIVFLTGITPDVFPTTSEVQASSALPLVCAVPTASKLDAETEWRKLFDLPLYVILTGSDGIQKKQTAPLSRRRHTVGEADPTFSVSRRAVQESSLSVLQSSQSFFVVIS